jgi:hypothetical protein
VSAKRRGTKQLLLCAGPSGLDSMRIALPELTLGAIDCRRFAPDFKATSESGLNFCTNRYHRCFRSLEIQGRVVKNKG